MFKEKKEKTLGYPVVTVLNIFDQNATPIPPMLTAVGDRIFWLRSFLFILLPHWQSYIFVKKKSRYYRQSTQNSRKRRKMWFLAGVRMCVRERVCSIFNFLNHYNLYIIAWDIELKFFIVHQ